MQNHPQISQMTQIRKWKLVYLHSTLVKIIGVAVLLIVLSGFFSAARAATAAARAADPARPSILVWSRDVPATLHGAHSLAWSLLGDEYDVRFLDTFGPLQPGQCQPQRLAASDLAGVALLVIGDWDGTFGCGTPGNDGRVPDVDANMSDDELALVEQFVARGGSLLAVGQALGRASEDNLPELLGRFGLTYTHSYTNTDTPVTAALQLDNRQYSIRANGIIYGVSGGNALGQLQGQPFAATTTHGQGRVAFLGSGRVLSDFSLRGTVDWSRFNYAPALLEAQNAQFVAALVAHLLDRAPPAPALLDMRLWRLRAVALRNAMSGGWQNGVPLGRNDADVAHTRALQAALQTGERCDVSSMCVPFAFEPGDAERITEARQHEEQAWDSLERMDALLAQASPDLGAVAQAHEEAVQAMNAALALVAPIRARPVQLPPDRSAAWVGGGALILALGTLICARRRRR